MAEQRTRVRATRRTVRQRVRLRRVCIAGALGPFDAEAALGECSVVARQVCVPVKLYRDAPTILAV